MRNETESNYYLSEGLSREAYVQFKGIKNESNGKLKILEIKYHSGENFPEDCEGKEIRVMLSNTLTTRHVYFIKMRLLGTEIYLKVTHTGLQALV